MISNTVTLHISLSDSLKRRVKDRVEEEHFSNPSDYIRALIREDLKSHDGMRLEKMIVEGLESGRGVTVGSPEWKKFWKQLHTEEKSKAITVHK